MKKIYTIRFESINKYEDTIVFEAISTSSDDATDQACTLMDSHGYDPSQFDVTITDTRLIH